MDSNTKASLGVIDRNGKKILAVLQREVTVQLFADWISRPTGPLKTDANLNGNAKRPGMWPPLELCANLYGPGTLFENVGTFAAKCNLYLQHPRNCDLNVPYRNPHCLSPEVSHTTYTFELNDATNENRLGIQIPANPIDLFADAPVQDALTDADTPQILSTELYKHQKQALTFMTQRERGWALDGHHRDIWKEEKDVVGRVSYVNTISGLRQTRPPDQFRGGLLIDAPGLGKSLSILALIALGVESQAQRISEKASSSTTLVIVPKTCKLDRPGGRISELTLPVIQMWKDELQK